MRRIEISRYACATFFIVAGILHFVIPEAYGAIVPAYLPWHGALVALSGLAETVGGAGLLFQPTRRLAGIGLTVLLIAVFPANVEMLRLSRERGIPGWQELLLWLRLPLQILLIWWVWRVSRPAPPVRAA